MQHLRLPRAGVVSATLAALGMSALFSNGIPTARAAESPLRIAEINWAGTPGDMQDQWVELTNVSDQPVTFSDAAPVKFFMLKDDSKELVATVGDEAGTLQPMRQLVLHREKFGVSSLLQLGSARYSEQADLKLASQPAEYRLEGPDGMPLDLISKGTDMYGSIPFAGSSQPSVRSMRRVDLALGGSQPANWVSSQAVGTGFTGNRPLQYGTPGAPNDELAAPADVAFSPVGNAAAGTEPTVTGTVGMGADSVTVRFERISRGEPFTRTYESFSRGSSRFSLTADGLQAGTYRVSATARSADGARSAPAEVGSYLISGNDTALPQPTLDQLPRAVRQPVVMLSGSLASADASVQILLNGRPYALVPVAEGRFGVAIDLALDSENVISAAATDSSGRTGLPVTVNIRHDVTAPLALQPGAVTFTDNAAGTQDTLTGTAGAAEPDSIVLAYADEARMQLIATALTRPDGSFGPIQVGDNRYDAVYLVSRDAAGNESQAATVLTAAGMGGSGTADGIQGALAPRVTAAGPGSLSVSWSALAGANRYLVKYGVNGVYGEPVAVMGTNTVLYGLVPGTGYSVAVAGVDGSGRTTAYAVVLGSTTAQAVPAVAGTGAQGNPGGSGYAAPKGGSSGATVQPPKPAPSAPAAAVTPAPGEVKSTSDTDSSRNWTPWIILAILLGIAILATAGYFYWFGGEAGEGVEAAALGKDAGTSGADPKEEGGAKKPGDMPKDRRW